nr:14154_t:CDS:2 [Entrophospora candida]
MFNNSDIAKKKSRGQLAFYTNYNPGQPYQRLHVKLRVLAKELQEIVKLLTEKPIIDHSKVKDIYEVAKKLRIGLQFAYFKVKWGLQKCDISMCERMVKQKLEDYKNYPNKQRTHLPFNVSPVPPSKNRFTDEKAKAVFEILDSLG